MSQQLELELTHFFRTAIGTKCHFTEQSNECQLFWKEGAAFNVYTCQDSQGKRAVCNNNCKGVDPNSIIGAGVAAAAVTGLVGTGFLPFLAATGGLAGKQS